jgi:hypothetical protein
MDSSGDTDILLTGLGFQYIKKTKRSNRIKDINSYWHPGFAWACTRKLYEKMNGLYEYAITGDGDMQMASCFLSNYASALPRDVSTDYKNSLKEFENNVKGCRLGYVPGVIRHYYHGSINDRKYDMREYILTKFNYSPRIHLSKNKDGLLIPSKDCPKELLETIINHFESKKEDSSILPFQINSSYIDLIKLLEYHFNDSLNTNCILLNLKKDVERFQSSKQELNKLSIPDGTFVHFDATYWKNKEQLEYDLNTILDFLRKFNTNVKTNVIIDNFSEPNDPSILIQSGPLACYCSHVNAMIYGYLNFENYTIICEDDISIDGLNNIEKYIRSIPNDWDIICLNSQPKYHNTNNPYYKFDMTFYHLHFYIIRNSCFETLFKYLYPITDQIDIIISSLRDKLNIYNIPNTVFQKNFITNIQNNLHVIYNTPVYSNLVKQIEELENLILKIINDRLPENNLLNEYITEKIIEDVIYNNMFNNIEKTLNVKRNVDVDCSFYNDPLYNQLNKILNYFTKNKSYREFILHLIEEIDFIISSFALHNTLDNGLKIKAYNFGSTSSVYISGNDIIKVYNKRLRWSHDDHYNIIDIYNNELKILLKLDYELNYDEEELLLQMNYKGQSLYSNFVLPEDYKKQIIDIFNFFNLRNIYYPEFNLNNIIIGHEDLKISFVDFGLARISDEDNDENCKNFIELLEILNDKFKSIKDRRKIKILYNTFIINMKNDKKYPKNIF